MTIISSQRYLDDDIVQAKRAAGDYVITVSPEFEVCGEMVRVLIDGHHSYAAAIADGVKPEIAEADALQDDRIGLLPDADAYLEASYMGDDWYDISTGRAHF